MLQILIVLDPQTTQWSVVHCSREWNLVHGTGHSVACKLVRVQVLAVEDSTFSEDMTTPTSLYYILL